MRRRKMRTILHRRLLATVAAAGVAGLALAGCTGDIAAEEREDTDCADYEQYGAFEGAEVTVSSPIVEVEAERLEESWADFETCTGITIEYNGTQEFEANIEV